MFIHTCNDSGAGTFGMVFKGTDVDSGDKIALKKIKMEKEKHGFPITAIREIKILKELQHKNIVHLREIGNQPCLYDACSLFCLHLHLRKR